MDCKQCLARQFSIYATAKGRDIRRLQALRADIQSFRTGQVIADERSEDESVFTLKEGWAYSYVLLADGRSQITDFHRAGDLLTAGVLLGGTDYAVVRALSDVLVCRFDRDRLLALIAETPDLREGMFQYMRRRQQSCVARTVALGALSAEEAMAALILSLARRAEERGEETDAIQFPLKLRHLADALGITEVHAGRVFRHLEATGAVARAGAGRLRVDIDRLNDILRGVGPIVLDSA